MERLLWAKHSAVAGWGVEGTLVLALETATVFTGPATCVSNREALAFLFARLEDFAVTGGSTRRSDRDLPAICIACDTLHLPSYFLDAAGNMGCYPDT